MNILTFIPTLCEQTLWNYKLSLTITSGESLTSLGKVFVAPFVWDFSVLSTGTFGPSRRHATSCLLQLFTSFLRPLLRAGDEWTRTCELFETVGTPNDLDFADELSRDGSTESPCPIALWSLGTLLSDGNRLSDKIGGMLKQKHKHC